MWWKLFWRFAIVDTGEAPGGCSVSRSMNLRLGQIAAVPGGERREERKAQALLSIRRFASVLPLTSNPCHGPLVAWKLGKAGKEGSIGSRARPGTVAAAAPETVRVAQCRCRLIMTLRLRCSDVQTYHGLACILPDGFTREYMSRNNIRARFSYPDQLRQSDPLPFTIVKIDFRKLRPAATAISRFVSG